MAARAQDTAIQPAPTAAPSVSPFDRLEKQLAPGDIANAEPGWQYIYTPAKDYAGSPASIVDWRMKLKGRGFAPINGPEYKGEPRLEYHASEPSAEIWRRPSQLRDDEWRAEVAAKCFSRHFASYYLRHVGALPWLPVKLRDAMFEWHGLKGDGKGERHTPELRAAIITMCRRLKVHPGPPTEE